MRIKKLRKFVCSDAVQLYVHWFLGGRSFSFTGCSVAKMKINQLYWFLLRLVKNRIPQVCRGKYAILVSPQNFLLSWHKLIPENKPNTLINIHQQLKEDHMLFYLLYMFFTFCTCCILRCLVCIVVSCLACIVVVVLCVLLSSYVYLPYYVCIALFTLDAQNAG